MRRIRAAKTCYIIASIASIVFGVILIIQPELSASLLCVIAGCVILISGAAKLFGYFSNDLYRLAFQSDLALGILTMILGAFMIFAPERFSKALVAVAAIYVIVNTFFTLQTAVEAKRFGLRTWWLLLVGAVLSGTVGILLLIKPFEGAIAITRLIGIAFAADGIQNLLVAVLTIHARNRVQP